MIMSSEIRVQCMQKNQLESLSYILSDGLCWWEGFKLGAKLADIDVSFMEVTMQQVRELNLAIKKDIK